MMDDFDLDNFTSPAVSEKSFCETALPYTSDIRTYHEHSSSDTTSDMKDEDVRHLNQMRDYVKTESLRGEKICLFFEKSGNLQPLAKWLSDWGPLPMASYRAASIVKDVASGLSALHLMKFSFGPSLLDAIYLDKDWRAYIYLSRGLLPGKVPGRWMMEDDMFRLGEILYRMLTGEAPFFDDEKRLQPVPKKPFVVDQKGLKLAYALLSCNPKTRPTAGTVIFDSWTDLCTQNGHIITFLF